MAGLTSLQARLFAAIALVAVVALVGGGWWLRVAVRTELDRQVQVERTVTPTGVVEEVRELVGPAGGDARLGLAAALDRRLWVALFVVLAGAALATAIVARRILGPVGDLHRAATAMAGGALDTRVAVRGRDEVAGLGRAFNDMAVALERAERQKRDLTNDVAHELRTPLTNLRCHVEALRDGVARPSTETAAALHDDVLQLQRLVDDLGLLAQVDARQLPLDPEPVDLGECVAGLARDLRARAVGAGVAIDATAPDTPVVARVDRGRLRQVLMNLIDNALAHTPAGGRMEMAAGRGVDGRATLRVTDTGEGIAPEHLPHVFDRFYRADPSRSRQTGGVGLGLAIARQIVRASGGDLTVESAPGRGTTFTIALPPF
ncbi:MAG TPA: HAMP domain-containing sensor histidine kinase [Vicinamibacterales bacterium]|nr:HAMP domain-containing sensor histidine kinase [Vicinamibacterales bacterium]